MLPYDIVAQLFIAVAVTWHYINKIELKWTKTKRRAVFDFVWIISFYMPYEVKACEICHYRSFNGSEAERSGMGGNIGCLSAIKKARQGKQKGEL